MMSFKILSNIKSTYNNFSKIMVLPIEMVEYLLQFCELKTLLKVRLAHSRLCTGANRGLAERLHLNWKLCLSNKMDPLHLAHYYPTLYFANLTVPIHLYAHTLSPAWLHDLKPDFIQSFLTLYPTGNVSLPSALIQLKNSISVALDNGEVLIWKKNRQGYESYQFSVTDSVALLYKDYLYKLFAISIRGVTTLVRSHADINPKLKEHLSKKGITIQSVYNNDWVILVKLSNQKLIYVTDPGDLSPPPDISAEDKIQKVLLLKSNLFLVWLENGTILVWGKELDAPRKLMIPEGQQIQSITTTKVDFTFLLEDRRTIIQYGYLRGIGNGLKMSSFKSSNKSLIKDIYTNDEDYLALLDNGEILTWSHNLLLVKQPVFPENYHVRSVFKSALSFCALLDDGRILGWGRYLSACNRAPTLPSERRVKTVFSTSSSCVALLDNQTILAWGNALYGGKLPDILVGVPVKAVFSNQYSFMALLNDGQVCYWGFSYKMIDIPKGRSVKSVLPSESAFLIQLDTDDLLPVFWVDSYPFVDRLVGPVIPLPKGKNLSVIDRGDFFVNKKGASR